jgi:colanic acid/amylovoran biosynthesis glycosyltransferase
MTREFRERPNAYTGLLQRTRPSDRFLPISDNWRRVLLDRGFSPEQTTVHRMGVDPTRFEPIEQPAHEGPLRVVSVCRLVEKKGIGFLIKAVALANREQPGTCVLDLYGDGPMRRELEAIASGEAVRFHGAVSQQAVVDALADADVLAAPSVTSEAGDQEGIPVAIMEAMARGLPVLTTRHSGIPELVEHDVSGLLADERDVAGLAANLQKLAASPDLRRRMGEAGRQKVIEQYDQRKLNDRLAQMIASISS